MEEQLRITPPLLLLPKKKKKKNAEEEEEKPMVYISWIFQIELLIHAGMD